MTNVKNSSLLPLMIGASVCLTGCYSVKSPFDIASKPVETPMQAADSDHDRRIVGRYGMSLERDASVPQRNRSQVRTRDLLPESVASALMQGTSSPPRRVDFSARVQSPQTAPPSPIGIYGELISNEGDRPTRGSTTGTENLAQVTFALEGACRSPHIESSGRWMTFSGTMHRPNADIYLKSVDGTTLTQLTTDSADDLTPQFSPTGEMIAFASDRSGNWDIWMIPAEGGVAIQVTDSSEHELHPTFSADGRQVAYCRFGHQSGRWEIWVTDLGRPGVQRFLTYGLFPQWSPDHMRSRIAFQRPREIGSRFHSVWVMDYRDGEAANVSEVVSAGNAAVMHPSWSPDGESLVFVTVVEPDARPGARPQVAEVWAIDADGRNRRNLARGEYANLQPTWAPDGRVYFVSDRSGIENIWSVRAGDGHHLRTWEQDFAGVKGEH